MALNDQLNAIEAQLTTLAIGLGRAIETAEDNLHKLRYDIEPKLDKALKGGNNPIEAKDIDQMLFKIRLSFVEVARGRKIEAIKALREATNAGLKEAKDTVEWMEGYLKSAKEMAVRESQQKAAE